jgi:hypothetical protein
MLEPAEIQASTAFTPSYRVLGSRRDQVRQLGNAVTPPAAKWLLPAAVDSLAGTDRGWCDVGRHRTGDRHLAAHRPAPRRRRRHRRLAMALARLITALLRRRRAG